jgi:hypothetical protein
MSDNRTGGEAPGNTIATSLLDGGRVANRFEDALSGMWRKACA